jgi:methylenetetrahydrofolate reductase (NADPH)
MSEQRKVVDPVRSGKPSLSLEFSAPKSDEQALVLWDTISALEGVSWDFVSMTYGAGGSTRDSSLKVTAEICDRTDFVVVGHITCVAAPRRGVLDVVTGYQQGGVHNILALRGDPPGDPTAPFAPHPEGFANATELVEVLSAQGGIGIGVAAFPEGHPSSPSLEHDAKVLVMKQQAGAQYAITQFFYDIEDYWRLVDLVSQAGGDIPIVPGVLPVTSLSQLPKLAQLTGSRLPAGLTTALEAVRGEPAEVRKVGMAYTAGLAQRLLDGGAPGLHFYTLNRSRATLELCEQLGLT